MSQPSQYQGCRGGAASQQAMAEQEARRAARIRQKEKDEEKYWEEVKQKNQLCLTKRRTPLTLLDVQGTTNQHAGKRGAFKSARQRAAEAKSVKARLQRQKAEQIMEQHNIRWVAQQSR